MPFYIKKHNKTTLNEKKFNFRLTVHFKWTILELEVLRKEANGNRNIKNQPCGGKGKRGYDTGRYIESDARIKKHGGKLGKRQSCSIFCDHADTC